MDALIWFVGVWAFIAAATLAFLGLILLVVSLMLWATHDGD